MRLHNGAGGAVGPAPPLTASLPDKQTPADTIDERWKALHHNLVPKLVSIRILLMHAWCDLWNRLVASVLDRCILSIVARQLSLNLCCL